MASTTNINGKRPLEDGTTGLSKRIEYDYSKLAKVDVGIPAINFVFPFEVIYESSGWFKSHFERIQICWKTHHAYAPLPEENPEIFRIYHIWLNSLTNDLATLAESSSYRNYINGLHNTVNERRANTCVTLIELWRLADTLRDSACKNEVINNLMCEKYWHFFSYKPKIYDLVHRTNAGSKLREWLIDGILPSVSFQYVHGNLIHFPEEMKRDVFAAHVAKKGAVADTNRPKEGDAAKYYE